MMWTYFQKENMISEKDKFILKLIENGNIKADEDGNVYRLNSKNIYHKIGSLNKYSGYYMSSLYDKDNKIKYNYKNHRIVYMYFHGPIDSNLVINHIDGVKTNNNISNLELVTQEDNIHHAFNNKMIKIPKGINNHKSVIKSQEDVENIRKLAKTEKINDIAKKYNISRKTVSRIVHYKRYA